MNYLNITATSPFYKIAERIVPFMTWFIITMPIWLSFFHPAVAAYLIMAYLLYFIFKSLKTIYFAGISLRIMDATKKIDWKKRLSEIAEHESIQHLVLIVNCRESYDKVSKTLDKLYAQSIDAKEITVLLAMEE